MEIRELLSKPVWQMTLGMFGEGDFFDLKGVIEELTEKLGFAKEINYEPTSEHPFLHPGRQANITKGKLSVCISDSFIRRLLKTMA